MGKKSIKVLHIDSEKGWRGGQQQVAYLAEGLIRNNYSTAIVCQPKSSLESYCREHGLPYFPIRMLNEGDFIAGLKIAGICYKHDFNILHLHASHSLSIGILAKIFYPKLRLIAVRRVDFPVNKNLFSRFKYRTNFVDRIVCISDGIRRVLLQSGVPEDKLITISSGINLKKFEHIERNNKLKENLGIPSDHLIVGTVAAMVGHKDYPNLLKAAKMVIDQVDRVSFCAVGDGPDREKITNLAQSLNLDRRFIFTGFQQDIGQFLKIFDIFVLASHLEGLGTSMLDAQAIGLPIVGSETGGIPEAVIHNQTGLLVPPQDEEALAKAILKLVTDAKLRKKFGEQALKQVRKFDINVTIKKNIQLYNELIN